MENFNLGIGELSVTPENPLFPNPVLPKTSVLISIQSFSEVPDQLGMSILSVTPGNPLLWTCLMENINLGIAKNVRYSRKSVISESGTPENICTRVECIRLQIFLFNFVLAIESIKLITYSLWQWPPRCKVGNNAKAKSR